MIQIGLPDDLCEAIKKVVPPSKALDAYVEEVLRERLASEEQKTEFYRLSDKARTARISKGVSEEAILEDFDTFREKLASEKTDG